MRKSEVSKIIVNELKTKIFSLDEKSKGWDHKVFIANTERGKFVIRIPIKDKNKIKLQAWVCKKWKQLGVAVPEPLIIRKSYIIETYIDGNDLSTTQLTMKQKYNFFMALGKQLKKMHSVKTKNFGYFKKEMVGKYSNWHSFIGEDFLRNIELCLKKNRINKNWANKLMKYYQENKDYLKKFNKPKLLHADLSKDNLMVKNGGFSGIIDAADALSGDPLYDIGGIFYEFQDKKSIDIIEKTYGTVDRKLVKFYALTGKVWLLSVLKNKEADKIKHKLNVLDRIKI